MTRNPSRRDILASSIAVRSDTKLLGLGLSIEGILGTAPPPKV